MLYIKEVDVDRLLTFKDAAAAIEEAFKLWASNEAVNLPRVRVLTHNAVLNILPGALLGDYKVAGLKAYLTTEFKEPFIVLLFSLESGDLLAIIEGDRFTQIRTAATSVIATKYMAKPNPEIISIIGSGKQAKAHFEAFAEVFNPKLFKVISKSREHAENFAKFIKSRGFDAVVVNSYEEACKADVLITATNSKEPFIKGSCLPEGIHINAIGSNWHDRAELMPDAVLRADIIAVDDINQAKYEAGDLIMAGPAIWNKVVPLMHIVIGKIKARTDNEKEITLFKSIGIAIEDVATAWLVYSKAIKEKVGTYIDFKGIYNLTY